VLGHCLTGSFVAGAVDKAKGSRKPPNLLLLLLRFAEGSLWTRQHRREYSVLLIERRWPLIGALRADVDIDRRWSLRCCRREGDDR
jgi:hypothetical protein